MPAVLHSL